MLANVVLIVCMACAVIYPIAVGRLHGQGESPGVHDEMTTEGHAAQKQGVTIGDGNRQSENRSAESWRLADVRPSLPLTRGSSVSDKDVLDARAKLRIGGGDFPEVSEYEIVRAAAAIGEWEKGAKRGAVEVEIGKGSLGDDMCLLVVGAELAMATGRSFGVLGTSPFKLPASVASQGAGGKVTVVSADEWFACTNWSNAANIRLEGRVWPQVLYTSPGVAAWLRDNFGAHAAFFVGNYLLGPHESSESCVVAPLPACVEGREFPDSGFSSPEQFAPLLQRCGVRPSAATLFVERQGKYSEYARAVPIGSGAVAWACALRSFVASRHVVVTFGSSFGFWAHALRGNGGSFVNPYQLLCVNFTNSQQGALWHMALPRDRERVVDGVNWRLMPCRESTEPDLTFYATYLTW